MDYGLNMYKKINLKQLSDVFWRQRNFYKKYQNTYLSPSSTQENEGYNKFS